MRLTKLIAYLLLFTAPAIVIVALASVWWAGEYLRADDSYPLKLEIESEQAGAFYPPLLTPDIDSDGNDDIVANDFERLLWYKLDGDKIVLAGERSFDGYGNIRAVLDANGDGRLEFLVLTEMSNSYGLTCYNWFSPNESSDPLYTCDTSLPLRKVYVPPPAAVQVGSFGGSGGDHPTVLVAVNTAKNVSGICRHLIAADGATGRELWRYDFSASIIEFATDEFGTGIPRVVLTTGALTQGARCISDLDSMNHAYCFDGRDGSLLWKLPTTNFYGHGYIVLEDLNDDGEKEILLGRYMSKEDALIEADPYSWNVAILNRDGSMLSSEFIPFHLESIGVIDFDGDSRPEIAVETRNAELIALNRDLAWRGIIRHPAVHYGGSNMAFVSANDFTGDGKVEILSKASKWLFLQDLNGKLLARQKCDENLIQTKVMRYEGGNRVVVMTGVTILNTPRGRIGQSKHIRVLSVSPQPMASRLLADWRRLAIGWGTIALAAGWSGFHVRRILRQRRGGRMDLLEAQGDLLAAMSAFGHGGSSLKALDRLRFHLKNWERIRPEGVTREELFARLLQIYRETIVPELEHLIMLSRRASVPEEVWGRLLSHASVAGKEMDGILTSGRFSANARQNERVVGALAALDALDGSLAGIRVHLRSVFRAAVAEELGRLVERFRYDYGESGVSFALEIDSSGGDAVFISPVSFGKIFESLLSNAIRATEGKPDAAIIVAVQWEGNYCRVDVRDNGCGIPREDWERIFERHYTTKKEGGFGLHYAREELAKFGGKIYVVDSVVGSGTTMRVVLRKSEDANAAEGVL